LANFHLLGRCFLWAFFVNYRNSTNFRPTFYMVKSYALCKFGRKRIGRFFHQRIWSPWIRIFRSTNPTKWFILKRLISNRLNIHTYICMRSRCLIVGWRFWIIWLYQLTSMLFPICTVKWNKWIESLFLRLSLGKVLLWKLIFHIHFKLISLKYICMYMK
jgi:hypothetical protein